MSLIRQALKKAADETESPPPLPSDEGSGGRKSGPFSFKITGLVILLLIGLSGILVYYFFPEKVPFAKIKPPLTPKPIVNNEIKPPNPAPVQKKEVTPPKVAEKVVAKNVPPLPAQMEKLPDQDPIKKKAENSTAVPNRWISPISKARIIRQPHPTTQRAVKKKGPGEMAEPAKVTAAQEEMDSFQVVSLFNEAVRNQRKGLFSQAIDSYQELLFIRPNHWETYNNLGLIYQEQKRFPLALEMFQKALMLNPRYLKGINNLGLYYFNLGKLEEAGNQFGKVLDLDPSFIPAYINLAVVLKKQGQVEPARKTLLKALEYDSENIEAHYNLGLLWEDQGVESKALEHYKKFISKAQGQGSYTALADELKKRFPTLK